LRANAPHGGAVCAEELEPHPVVDSNPSPKPAPTVKRAARPRNWRRVIEPDCAGNDGGVLMDEGFNADYASTPMKELLSSIAM
jgi:hypothetical protein